MELINRSNFYDFKGEKFLWRFWLQALILPGTYYYYDKKNKSYCLERRNVKGEIVVNHNHHYIGRERLVDACFVPKDWLHPFLHYHQMIYDYEEFKRT